MPMRVSDCRSDTVDQFVNFFVNFVTILLSIYQILLVCFTGMIINNCNGNK